jgi:putative hydrolase of the HAD superfamily
MIRTLIFDLGKVIIPFDFQRGYDALAERTGLPADEVRTRVRRAGWYQDVETGRLPAEQFHRNVMQELGLDWDLETFRDVFSLIFEPRTLLDDAFLEALHRRYRLVLLSNTNGLHFPWIQPRYPILRHFDQLVLSYQVGHMKPDPEIYEAAIAAAECPGEECFYTDDIPEYVAGARLHGIRAFLFQNQEQTQADLISLDVHW